MSKKIKIIVLGATIATIIAGTLFFYINKGSAANNKDAIYVEAVSMITGSYSALGVQNRFSGVIEPQDTLEIKLDTNKIVKECLVEVGQAVEVGTPLFTYDTGEMSLNLEQGKLELERIANEIIATNRQIQTLESEKANASNDEILAYTIEIQSLQNSLKRAEYNKSLKEVELEQLKKSIENATVSSSIKGVIKSINQNNDPNMGGSNVYITVLATGDYRVKAITNEQNILSLTEGQKMIARSRRDENKTWTGVISKIDRENPINNNNNSNGMVNPGDIGVTPASKYNFYISLDSYEELMLGQHVFVEIDNGVGDTKEGLWLPSYYLVVDGDKAYSWIANSKNKLEKKFVTLGEYDEVMDKYEIVEGITDEDYIAFPQENFEEGTKIIKAGEEKVE